MKKNHCLNGSIKRNLTFLVLIGLITITISCKNTSRNEELEQEDKIANDSLHTDGQEAQIEEEQEEIELIDSSLIDLQTDLSTKNFIKNLKEGNNLSGFFADNWTLIFHKNSRYDGNTDGKVAELRRFKVDDVITLNVFTDGDGWEQKPESIGNKNIQFDLKETTQEWDAFNTENIDTPEKNMVYISTFSQSEYLQVYYNNDKKIIKLKYNLVDPG